MGPSEFSAVFEAFNQLDRQLAAALSQAELLAVEPQPTSTLRALAGLRHALGQALGVARELRVTMLHGAVTADGLRDLALRERITSVVIQMAELRLMEDEVAHYAPELFGARVDRGRRFHSLSDVMLHVLRAVGRANELRLQARTAANAWDDGNVLLVAEQRDRYVQELEAAERTFMAIGNDPEFEHFLDAGAWLPNEAFRIACRVIATLLDLPLRRGVAARRLLS